MAQRTLLSSIAALFSYIAVASSDQSADPLQLNHSSVSFLRAPVAVSISESNELFPEYRDSEFLDAIEQIDGRNNPETSGFSRAARTQVLLGVLRGARRIKLNLGSAATRRYKRALATIGLDDDLERVRAHRPSRQAVRTREVLAFLFDDPEALNQKISKASEDNVFQTVVWRRSQANALAIEKAYTTVMPILQQSFDRFCIQCVTQMPRVNDGMVLGSFSFNPPRKLWQSEDGWTTIERWSTADAATVITGQIRRVEIQLSPAVTALIAFLSEALKSEGSTVKVRSPSGLETLSVDRGCAEELSTLLRTIPSAVYLGRNFRSPAGAPLTDERFDLLRRTSGTYVFALEYAR